MPASSTTAGPDAPPVPPDLEPAFAPNLRLPIARSAPARPRAAGPASSSDESEPSAARPAAPTISPRLTPQELADAEHQTQESIDIAERNLQVALGRSLSTTQSDLVEKIRAFLGQAREAARNADWLRARNLAEKAQVLSVELVHSL